MFDSLAEKLQATLADVRGRGTLTEADVNAAMREIRLALLEADVNFKVVKSFTNAVKERALGADVIGQLNPGQQVVKIVSDELTELMGGAARELSLLAPAADGDPDGGTAGLGQDDRDGQARALPARGARLVGRGRRLRRLPAGGRRAADQGRGAGRRGRLRAGDRPRPRCKIAAWARDRAQTEGKDVLIVDTSGRSARRRRADEGARRHQEGDKPARRAARRRRDDRPGRGATSPSSSREAVEFDGVIMTKLDGDARGGAALSVKAITGKPILFASTGEKLDQFERFHPDRMAQRILGMGDVMTLIEKAQGAYDEEQAAELERKFRKQEFDLDDFLDQMRQIRRLGPLQSLLGMIPGLGKELRGVKVDEREFDRIQAIILSMTPQERRHPELIKGSRRLRIATRLGHQRAGRQGADQAVRADAQGDAPGLAGPDAGPRRADATEPVVPALSAPTR